MHLKEIQRILKSNSTPEAKASAEKFVPGVTHVYGVKMPVLNELAGEIKDGGFALVQELWDAGMYEERILAAKLLRKICKQDAETAMRMVKKFSKDIDNWALCDTLGMQSLKPLNKKYAEQIFALAESLSASKNMWQRRLSLVLVEDLCKDENYHLRIQKLIAKQKSDKEYYIKKAVIWLEASLAKHS